ncbi:CHAT domain-containing protein [Cellulomonas chitinilytica]|uniref:CHAT domain-containing protein n=1 Tax=Cellulomonas chitinilytica TaxID=398759 RepID=A0A919U1C0_9CELL|nr:CHAT domain-containing tetratricopeptide repeat protein [Cellulomonas chitinilytica]GIG20004.1 CHAT domain-containing protein [Cellulomonas chitinilytica]
MTELDVRAQDAMRLAASDPGAAAPLAAEVSRAARHERRWDVVCVAERALGVAAMQQSRFEDALRHLRAAVVAGERAADRTVTGEARMSLASALMLSGRPQRSFREIDQALVELDGLPAARARTQRAAIYQDLGRLDEALEDLRRALPVLRAAHDAQWATRALSNRGLLHATRREFAAARRDLRAAGELCDEHGLRVPAAFVEHNLAWVDSQAGDVPSALQHMAAATRMFTELGLSPGSLLTDHAELLLSVRLVAEARSVAEDAVAADERDGRRNHLPESRLLLSTIALVQGDTGAALRSAEAASREFARLRRREWAALADFSRVQALAAADGPVTPARCRRAADALSEAGWTVPALEARLLAGRLALRRGRAADARRDFAMAGRARHLGPADARARAWLGEAMLREADGRRGGAVSALRAGIRVLEDHRATIGATELRAHVSINRGAIARMGMQLAVEDHDARASLWWAECAKATAAPARDARPPTDAALADLLADLRGVMDSVDERRSSQQPTGALVARQVALEREIRDHCRRHPGSSARSVLPPDVATLADALGDAALIEFVELADELLAVTVVGGRARLHRLGPTAHVAALVEQIPFALRRLARDRGGDGNGAEHHRTGARNGAASVVAAAGLLAQACAALGEALLRPVLTAVADRPLVVVPTGSLHSVPWSLLPACTGRAVSVSPSATLWHVASGSTSPAGRTVVVAGPGLPGARAEAEVVAGLHESPVVLVGDEATARNVSHAMDGAALVHLAAHGRVRSDNPQFSSLALADGPFTVYDLERLDRAPHQVVLAACDTGRSALVAGGEILGFTSALLAGGTATLVAPVVPVPDIATVDLMRAYHRGLAAGHPPAHALAAAQEAMGRRDHASLAAAAGFVQLGYGGQPHATAPGVSPVPARRSSVHDTLLTIPGGART